MLTDALPEIKYFGWTGIPHGRYYVTRGEGEDLEYLWDDGTWHGQATCPLSFKLRGYFDSEEAAERALERSPC